jgi:hypothetical protein
MSEPMTTWDEVWAVVADDEGQLWLLGGCDRDAWLDGPVMADNSEHAMVQSILRKHGINPGDAADPADAGELLMLHSTCWRPDGPRRIDTFLVAVKADGVVLERWPDALPITPDLYGDGGGAPGKPPTHGATEEPVPRELDVLFHGLGHFKQQMRVNGTHRAALGEPWRIALEPFEETLAGMYETPHQSAA